MAENGIMVIAESPGFGMRGYFPNGDYVEPDPPAPVVDNLHYFVFGHSLFTWDAQIEPGSTAESSTGYWLGDLANQSGTQSAGSGQFGQLEFHSIPPIPAYAYATNAYDPWPSGGFADQDFNAVLFMPSNFEQAGLTPAQYLDRTFRVLDYVEAEAPNTKVVCYEHWPEPVLAGSFGDNANLTEAEWDIYKTYTVNEYHDWFLEYQNLIMSQRPSIDFYMVPIGPIITDLLNNESYMSTVTYTDLFVDDAPHGSRSMYFLAALICYRALFIQNPSTSYVVPNFIIPEIRNNYPAIVNFIEMRLNFHQQNGVRVYA